MGDLCLSDADCIAGAVCNQRRGLCQQLSTCFDTTSSTDCGANEHCIYDGSRFACTDSLDGADNCFARSAVTVSGRAVTLEALALDSAGVPVAFGDIEWSGDVDGSSLTVECAGPAACDVEVTATTRGDATCIASVRVYPPLPAGATRVIVSDENGVPLVTRADAFVDGAIVSVSADDGSATFAGDVAFVNVVPEGREAHTFLAPLGDVFVVSTPLRTTATGLKGTVNFDEMSTQGDIKVAIVGLPFPSLVDVTREDLLGVEVTQNIEIEGVTVEGGVDVTLPSAFVMNLGDNPLKGDWIAFGAHAPGWVLGMQIPLVDIGNALINQDFNATTMARALLPVLGRADHGIHVVPPATSARPEDAANFGAWDFPESVCTPNVGVLVDRSFSFDVEHDLVTAALAFVPTRGFIVLGIGEEELTFAPPHGGLEGNEVVIAALDIDLDTFETVRASFAAVDEPLPAFVPHLEATFDGVNFASTNDPGADVYRVRFDGWTVWSTSPPTFSIDELGVDLLPTQARAEAIIGSAEAPRAIASRPIE